MGIFDARTGAILDQAASQAPVAPDGASTASCRLRGGEPATAVSRSTWQGTDERGTPSRQTTTLDHDRKQAGSPGARHRWLAHGQPVVGDRHQRRPAPRQRGDHDRYHGAEDPGRDGFLGKIKVTATDCWVGVAGTTYRITGGELLTYTVLSSRARPNLLQHRPRRQWRCATHRFNLRRPIRAAVIPSGVTAAVLSSAPTKARRWAWGPAGWTESRSMRR